MWFHGNTRSCTSLLHGANSTIQYSRLFWVGRKKPQKWSSSIAFVWTRTLLSLQIDKPLKITEVGLRGPFAKKSARNKPISLETKERDGTIFFYRMCWPLLCLCRPVISLKRGCAHHTVAHAGPNPTSLLAVQADSAWNFLTPSPTALNFFNAVADSA